MEIRLTIDGKDILDLAKDRLRIFAQRDTLADTFCRIIEDSFSKEISNLKALNKNFIEEYKTVKYSAPRRSGKTTLLKDIANRLDDKLKVGVTAGTESIRKYLDNPITLDEDCLKGRKLDVLLIDEHYILTDKQLETLAQFRKRNPDMFVFCTGTPYTHIERK